MVGATLLGIAARQAEVGQQEIAESMKRSVASTKCRVAGLLDYTRATPFLEPSLFTYFGPHDTRATLDQILCGYLRPEVRPSSIDAFAGADGVIHLPRIGYLATGERDRIVALRLPKTFEEPEYVEGTDIEVCRQLAPPVDRLFNGGAVGVERRKSLDVAFHILKCVAPEVYEALLTVTRRVVLFHDKELNSFASFSAHGTGFFNVSAGNDEVFFIEDIAHQCGHVLFNAVTVHRNEFFSVDPDTPLKAFTGEADERRTAYVTLHGVFTECLMCICLYRCYEMEIFSGRRRHELLGRLSFILKRFSGDLMSLSTDGLFSERGEELFAEFGGIFDVVYRRAKDAIVEFDLSNQPYTFTYDKFLALNPGE